MLTPAPIHPILAYLLAAAPFHSLRTRQGLHASKRRNHEQTPRTHPHEIHPRQLMLSFSLLLLLIGTEFHPAAAATPSPSPPTQNGDLVVEIMQTGP